MAGIPYSDRRLYTKAGSKRKRMAKRWKVWYPKRREYPRYSDAARAAYWKRMYLALLKSRSR